MALTFYLSKTGGFSHIRRPGQIDQLLLTQDIGLQPALEVSAQVKRRADAIFDKEQDILVEEANMRPQKKPQLYIDENG